MQTASFGQRFFWHGRGGVSHRGVAFCESVPRWFPEFPVTPRPPRFRAPEPLLEAPVGVPIKCPALPRYPPKPRLPDPFQGFQGTRPPAYQP